MSTYVVRHISIAPTGKSYEDYPVCTVYFAIVISFISFLFIFTQKSLAHALYQRSSQRREKYAPEMNLFLTIYSTF